MIRNSNLVAYAYIQSAFSSTSSRLLLRHSEEIMGYSWVSGWTYDAVFDPMQHKLLWQQSGHPAASQTSSLALQSEWHST